MANVIDYLDWRGDLRFTQSPFCDVDALILSRLAIHNFEDIVPISIKESISLADAAIQILEDSQTLHNARLSEDLLLLKKAGEVPRFQGLQLCGFYSEVDPELGMQFAALVFRIDADTLFVSFRGTDDSITGWRENFNMSFISPVPSQEAAVKYLEFVGSHSEEALLLGGHSKGGNLAVYAAAFCGSAIQPRIIQVYNNDGPGFNAAILAREEYRAVSGRIMTFVPQSSIVGMFLEHEENYTIIKSTQMGLLQHQIYSWEVRGNHLVTLDTVTNASIFIDRTLKDWIARMAPQEREKFVSSLFTMIEQMETTSRRDPGAQKRKLHLLRQALQELDPDKQRVLSESLLELWAAIKHNLPILRTGAAEPAARRKRTPDSRQYITLDLRDAPPKEPDRES